MKINVKTVGEGKTILILHGWGSSQKSWEKVQNNLANRGYKVVVPDMPGFGGSDSPPVPWSGKDYLDWLLEFIKVAKLGSPLIIIGHSFGGGLAMKLAIDHPEIIEKLVLVAAARTGTKKSLKKEVIYKIAKLGKYLKDYLVFYDLIRNLFYRIVVREKDYFRTRGTMKETIKLILKENVTPEIDRIKAPTLIVWGTNDKATPIENARLIHDKIKGSHLETLKGVGHAISLEQPEKLADIIYKFLKIS